MLPFDNIESVAEPNTYRKYNLGDTKWDNRFNLARQAIEYQENHSDVCIRHDRESCYQYTKIDEYVGHEDGEVRLLEILEVLSELYRISNIIKTVM